MTFQQSGTVLMILDQVRNSRIPFVHVLPIEIGAKVLRNNDLYQTSFFIPRSLNMATTTNLIYRMILRLRFSGSHGVQATAWLNLLFHIHAPQDHAIATRTVVKCG